MITGTVKFFNGTKGFGFITPDDGSKEVFVPTATVTASVFTSLTLTLRASPGVAIRPRTVSAQRKLASPMSASHPMTF